MQTDDVVRMANQIAEFFAIYPEADAVEGVRDHLEKFWTPAMRKELVEITHGLRPVEGTMHPLVLRAAVLLRAPADGLA
ncbi:MAG: formate dehydrogenase subunit delta [Gemmatimonadetes bacterium]|nr:formate dehydrogenase subunit delta [Gemmatimonadota bacterium]